MKGLLAACCIVLLASPAAAHVPAACDAIRAEAEPMVYKKMGIANLLEQALAKRDPISSFELTRRYLALDNALFGKMLAWVECVEE